MPLHPALLSSDLEHWLTPASVLDLVVQAMGGIDLDPASNRASIVPANESCYVGEQNGLLRPWTGNVWCNPPYGSSVTLWTERMHQVMRKLRSADQLIALLPARTDAAWCQRHVLESADAFLFWSGRITFWRAWEPEQLLKLTGRALPPPFRKLDNGIIIGPDLDKFGKPSPAPFPSLVPYWGPDPIAFGRVFRPFGTLVIRRGPKAGVYARKAA